MSEIQLPLSLPRDLQIHTMQANTPEWYKFRERGIGGSEVGYIMGLSPYKCSMEVFQEKIGEVEPFSDDNEASFHGKYFENYLRKIWKYYDGSKIGYIKNQQARKVAREYLEVSSYVVNPKYPWLFASVDGLINAGQFTLLPGAPILEKPGILEVKTISSMYARLWEEGIPPQYLTQVHQYMLIMEVDYAEIILLKDGRYIDVMPIERNEKMCQAIIDVTKEFWYNSVVPAQECKVKATEAEKNDRFDLAEQYAAKIQMLEPGPDSSEAYKNFMANKQLFDPIEKEGTQDDLFDLIAYKKWHEVGKIAKSNKTLYENKVRKRMSDVNADKLDLDESGYVSLTTKKGSTKTVFNNRIKIKLDIDAIKEKIENVNL